jgi:starch-binding outer membrane protein, SusD/RagB family
MKKITIVLNKCLVLAAMMILYSGCAKLEEKPLSSISPETFYTTIPQCESALTGAMARLYSEWNDQSYGYGFNFFKRDDQLAGGNDNIPAAHGTPLWGSHWGAILNCNGVLKATKRGFVTGGSAADIETLNAQAKFIRAWNYFQLVRLWGGLPVYTEDNEDPTVKALARATIAEVYTQVISDFTYAGEKLPASWPSDKQGRPTKAAAYGLMAKAYLTMATNPLNAKENYAKARDAAKIVMTDGIHDLMPKIEDVFKRENKYSPEMLWSLIANSADPTSSAEIWNTNDGWGDNAAEDRLDSVWPAQPRKTAYLQTVNAAGQNYHEWGGTQSPYCKKFLQPNITQSEWDSYSSYANMPVIRFADVLLIYAEAANMAAEGGNPPQDACDAINRVIDRANGGTGVINPDERASRTTTAWTKEQFDARVIQERNFELCFEYDRWFDLIRKRMLGDPEVHPPYRGYVYKESDNLWPIPILDMQQNKLFVQNPGY